MIAAKRLLFYRAASGNGRDTPDAAGLYFGTNGSLVFASREAGVTWDEIARHLPIGFAAEVPDQG
jgi:hypothetical protein